MPEKKYDFDSVLDRRHTCSLKWEFCEQVLGVPEVIPMWVADMDFPAPPEVVDAVIRRAQHGAYGYPFIPRSFWSAIINWMKVRHNWEIKREWLSRCHGVVPALNICVQTYTAPGDKIIVQSPVYYPFFSAVENNGRRVVSNPLRFDNGTWRMDFDDLKNKIDRRTRVLILCSPHNPVGRVWRKEELEKLAEICLKHELLIISDEIHAEHVYRGHKHIPIASISPEIATRTITLTAPSKAFNIAGLTTSLVIIPNQRLLNLYKTQLDNLGLTVNNIFGLVALEAAYTQGADWLDQLMAYLEDNMDFARNYFEEKIPQIKFLKPEGTYLALLDCRALGLPQKELNEFFLKKARVYFDEGPVFGPELEGFERMNLACPRVTLVEALHRIEKAVRELGR
ncbi:MAG: PatB family C-S lyase [Candidatus Saccharicenans sp.]|jgi:cystathionine beta-lyase|nr:PatB family C-S lyase [Candidatus Saccharicenans sp.]MDH7576177.1 PatB family C-S lyase [Candidatus Saccharicenans sp.]